MEEPAKKCTGCAKVLPIDAFHRSARARDGHQSQCRDCTRATWKRWYSDPENRARHVRHNGGTSKDIVRRNQHFVMEVLLASACADCGIEDHRVLEFDHVRDTKFSAVSEMISSGYSVARIRAEIDKCDVVCANCHRIRTGARGAYFRHTQGD